MAYKKILYKAIVFVVIIFLGCCVCGFNIYADEPLLLGDRTDDFEVPQIEENDDLAKYKKREIIPEKYDSRDDNLISSVKNQEDYNICWAYSAVACAETAAMQKQIYDFPDFSEMHLAYYFSQKNSNLLSSEQDDWTEYLEGDYITSGLNSRYASFALLNWIGIADKSKYPNIPSYYEIPHGNNDAYNDEMHLQNVKWISMNDTDFVKKAVMSYGALALSYYNASGYFDETGVSYYNPFATSTNHSVTLVGWDDSYSADNFRFTPETDGAWLVKGSWGEQYGDLGYYWISYCDKSLTSSSATVYLFDFEQADNYDNNYYYDGSCGTKTANLAAGKSMANIYTACGNISKADEQLEAIGFAVADTNVDYKIQIFTDLEDLSKPTSGRTMLKNPIEGTTDACGYYTIPLEEVVKLKNGQVFSVVISLNKSGSTFLNYFVDQSYDYDDWISFHCSTNKNQSFYQTEDDDWIDLHDVGKTARIKAYTSNLNTYSVSGIGFKKEAVTMIVGAQLQQIPIILPQEADISVGKWESSNPQIAKVSDDGMVTAITVGEANISYTLDGVSGSFRVVVKKSEVKNTDADNLGNVNLNENKVELVIEKPIIKDITVSNNAFTVVWQKIDGADGYYLYRKCNNGKLKKIKTIDKTKNKYIDRDISNGKYYQYIVEAYVDKQAIASDISQKKFFLSKVKINKKSKKNKMIKLVWKKNKKVSGYQIQYSLNEKYKDKKSIWVKSAKKNTINLNIKPKKKYYIRIRAYKTYKGKKYYSVWNRICIK